MPEYQNTLYVNGIHLHWLVMKLGAPIMLIRNINPKVRLCSGTRLIVKSKHGQVLKSEIAGGDRGENMDFIPLISFTPNETDGFPMQWKRRQFPVRTLFVMTINKSQSHARTKFFILECNRKCYWTTSICQEAKDIVHIRASNVSGSHGAAYKLSDPVPVAYLSSSISLSVRS